ncbi:hypothetical protein HMPREF1981_03152 [Bacteroides pyogenes F0041]|uniref:Uncharacterized protein n=2 Tax=Bacteroides pyogenes TaxID=310300 RepID=U2BTG6_9BACE|nr:hypothetical protein [Bacteroides pyogenes]ERI81479.1 hypothetical protein HMPREF1981_03152 [Bacteroides pyogenes F0041]
MNGKNPATASPISFDVQPDFSEVKEETRLLLCPVAVTSCKILPA